MAVTNSRDIGMLQQRIRYEYNSKNYPTGSAEKREAGSRSLEKGWTLRRGKKDGRKKGSKNDKGWKGFVVSLGPN
ncbi:hypothetical protein EMCG_05052 [[Emmonsia] crescens]|uniref:Uncharacterized protein n=1 Tax=[Emmonsia] crescens TaxID=73230 RepID=A0A0G2HQ65_9EURO|nr:hypothetical protein EMCG_05052 [Emmonsia crescens UAMH 3008]